MNPPLRHLGFATTVFLQIVVLWAMWYLPWRFDVQQLHEGREWLSAVAFGFLIAQASLVGLWSALGPARLPLRAVSSLFALVALYIASYSFYFRFEESTPLDLALLLAFCILLAWVQVLGATLWLTWSANLRLSNPRIAADERPASQFHLWHILVAITATGILLAASRGLINKFNAESPFDLLSIWFWLGVILFVVTTFAVATALIAAAATMSSVWPVRATVAGLIVVAFYSIFLERLVVTLVDSPSTSDEYHILTNLVAYVWTVLAMNLVRLDGWRWEDRDPKRERGGIVTRSVSEEKS